MFLSFFFNMLFSYFDSILFVCFFIYKGLRVSNSIPSGSITNARIATFEMEHSHWLEEQNRRVSELRIALQAHLSDIELRMLVESCLNHYANLFRMKSDAAKADVFYLISGIWRTCTERFFQWIGGFRPSELLNVTLSTFYY